tara:strand:+ start:106 stop:474 length:369 start_codon:yes stop_codon:yes gene_type:complete
MIYMLSPNHPCPLRQSDRMYYGGTQGTQSNRMPHNCVDHARRQLHEVSSIVPYPCIADDIHVPRNIVFPCKPRIVDCIQQQIAPFVNDVRSMDCHKSHRIKRDHQVALRQQAFSVHPLSLVV